MGKVFAALAMLLAGILIGMIIPEEWKNDKLLNQSTEYAIASDTTVKIVVPTNWRYLEKDEFVISHLNKKPTSIEKKVYETFNSETVWKIKYDDCMFTVYYEPSIPYVSEEKWSYFCRSKDGEFIMLESVLDIPQHRCSDSVYRVIQEYCKALK